MFKRISVVVNPVAGGKKDKSQLIARLTKLLSAPGRSLSIQYTEKSGDANRLAREAVQQNSQLVVVIGGDGTVNEVGSALVDTDVPMAIIPRGSGNGFARTLRLPPQLEDAAALINDGAISLIDVGQANERYFFMLMGVGFDARIGERFNAHSSRGPLPYFYLSAKEFFNYRPAPLQINFNGKALALAPFMIIIANAQQFGNNARIAPHAILNDGLLDICIVRRLSFFDLLFALPKLFSGRIHNYSGVEFYQAQQVQLQRERADFINLDGEAVWEEAVVNVRVLPRRLKVITPKFCPALAP